MRHILNKVLGPVQVNDDLSIQTNSELYELLNDMDIVQRMHWLGYIVRLEKNAPGR